MTELLLLSNSTSPGLGFLEHARAEMAGLVRPSALRTTNDMPIVAPRSFDALGLIPFQINPHYLDPDPASSHQGETREQRIEEFFEENDVPVLGLREGSWLRVSDRKAAIGGTAGGRLFARGASPRELPPGSDVSALLETRPRFDVGRGERAGGDGPG